MSAALSVAMKSGRAGAALLTHAMASAALLSVKRLRQMALGVRCS